MTSKAKKKADQVSTWLEDFRFSDTTRNDLKRLYPRADNASFSDFVGSLENGVKHYRAHYVINENAPTIEQYREGIPKLRETLVDLKAALIDLEKRIKEVDRNVVNHVRDDYLIRQESVPWLLISGPHETSVQVHQLILSCDYSLDEIKQERKPRSDSYASEFHLVDAIETACKDHGIKGEISHSPGPFLSILTHVVVAAEIRTSKEKIQEDEREGRIPGESVARGIIRAYLKHKQKTH